MFVKKVGMAELRLAALGLGLFLLFVYVLIGPLLRIL
jgi:hypothetical protein